MMRKFTSLLLAISSIFALVGCGDTTESNAQASVMGDITAGSYQSVGIRDAKLFATDETGDLVILDVRTPAEYAEGHLMNAVNIDYESPDFASKIQSLIKSKKYLVYCRSGRRSAAASQIMADAGFTNIINMLGGINAWKEAGGEIAG